MKSAGAATLPPPSGRRTALTVALVVVLSIVVGVWPDVPSDAAFPGANGDLVFADSGDLYVMRSGGAPTQLAATGAFEDDPKFSPDGSRIVFISNVDHLGGDVFVMEADGSNVVQLTDDGNADQDPTWSPDGEQLAFLRDQRIHIMNADGGGLTELSAFEPEKTLGFDIDWSVDDVLVFGALDSGLHVMDADGTGLLRIADGLAPNWSPDGTRIVYTSETDLTITTIRPDGTGFVELGVEGNEPAYSPDGTRILFQGFTDTGSTIETMATDGSDRDVIVEREGLFLQPDWAPVPLLVGGPFGDVGPDHLFVDAITWLADEGITKGCNPPANTLFCPDDVVTRGQMAAFLVRALGYVDDGGGDRFIDDDGTVFEGEIDRLATAGVTKGCNPPFNDRFCPQDPVSRQQMASFLVRALDLDAGSGDDLFVDDDGSIHELDIDALGTAGVTKGCNPPTNDRFCPTDVVTRGQMAAFLFRALG